MKPDDRHHITVSTHELEARIAQLRSQGHYVRAMEVVAKCNGLWRLTIERAPAQPELPATARNLFESHSLRVTRESNPVPLDTKKLFPPFST